MSALPLKATCASCLEMSASASCFPPNMRKRNSVCWALLGLVIAAPFAFAEEQASISRLPPLPQPLDPILQDMFDKRRAMGGAIINLQLTTGHAPKFTRASAAMAFTIRFDAATPRRLLE